MGLIPLLLLIAGIGVLSWLAWISLQSLFQARALIRLARHPSGEPDDFGRHAVYGRVEVARALRYGGTDLLWVRIQQQVYRRRRKNSGWSTVSTEDQKADFTIDTRGGPVRLSDFPTEVQGTGSWTEVYDQSGWFGGHGDGDRRTVYTYLAITGFATAVGRLEGQGVGRDNKLGLLLSPHEPRKAASIELWKGVGGLAVVTAAIVIGLVLYYR